MAKIGIRTNHTREVERPPLLIQPVSTAFWADILRMAVKPAGQNATRASRKKAADNNTTPKPATPAAPAKQPSAQPVTRPANTPVQKTPVNRFSQPGLNGGNGQKPLPGSNNGGNSAGGSSAGGSSAGGSSAGGNYARGNNAGSNNAGGNRPSSNTNNDRVNGQNNTHHNNHAYNRAGTDPAKPVTPPTPARPSESNRITNNPPAQRGNSFNSGFNRWSNPPAPRSPVPGSPTTNGTSNNGSSKGPAAPNRLPADRPNGQSAVPQQGSLKNVVPQPQKPAEQRPEGLKPEPAKPEAPKPSEVKAETVQPEVHQQEVKPPPIEKPAETVQPEPSEDQKPQRLVSADTHEETSQNQPKGQPLNGSQPNGNQPNGKQPHENGREKLVDSRITPTNGNGNGKAPVDGMKPHNGNGSTGSSSLFRSGAYSGMTSFRSRPASAGPEQIPLVNPSKPGNIDHAPARNGNGKAVDPPSAPVTPNPRPAAPVSQPRSPQTQRQTLLKYLLHQHPELPAQSAIFGVSEDELPVLVDLNDPGPGAVLTISDERQAELDLLRTVMASLAARNTARGVQFLIFSCDPQGWSEWITHNGYDRLCLAVVDTEAEAIREWTLQLADWTEQRCMGQRSGPPVVLICDTLNFLTRLEYDVRLNFEWMAKEGPQAQIWPVAAISSELAQSLNSRRLLRSFQTRILGYFNNPADYSLLTKMNEQAAASFGQPGQFAVQLGEDWLRFNLLGLK